MEFRKLVEQVLSEEMTSGGSGSVYGAGVTSTETPISGDNYASGDARNVLGGAFPGVLTRNGLTGKKRRSKKKSKKK